MRTRFTFFIIVLAFILLAGCAAETQSGVKLVNGKPYWFYNPSLNGKIGGVGVSGIHVDGKTGQKSLATQRALEEIARQMGVKVDSYASLRTSTTDNSATVSGESSSFFTVDGKEVKAMIKEEWEDPYTHELYVWMVTE